MRTLTRLIVLCTLPLLIVAAFPTPVETEVTPLQQLFVMKELKPDMKLVGVLWDKNVGHDDILPQIQRAAASAGVKVVVSGVGDVKEIAPSFRDLVRTNRIDVLWIIQSDRIVDSDLGRKFIIKSAAEHALPILAPTERWVNEGACVTLKTDGANVRLLVNKAAAQAASIKIPEKYLERTQFLAAN